MNWDVPRIWEGGSCFIIGGGPSVPRQFGVPEEIIGKVLLGALPVSFYSDYFSEIHDKHVIGVNNAYQIGNWLDCLFFGDCGWYLAHREPLSKWNNMKVTCCPRFANKPKEKSEGIKFLAKDSSKRFGISENSKKLSWNLNSGAAAINLAFHFGVKRILLLGFDMRMYGDSSHWHMGHGSRKPPPFSRHLKGFQLIAEDAQRLGLEILNISSDSVVSEFKKVSLRDVI